MSDVMRQVFASNDARMTFKHDDPLFYPHSDGKEYRFIKIQDNVYVYVITNPDLPWGTVLDSFANLALVSVVNLSYDEVYTVSEVVEKAKEKKAKGNR